MKIDEAALTTVIVRLGNLTQTARATAMDEVQATQPQLFDMVLMQKSLGATLETMDCLLEILLVCSSAATHMELLLPTISDDTMISELNRFVKEVGFAADVSPTLLAESVNQYRTNHAEPVLFRWALQQMTNAGLTDFASDQQSALLSGCTIVNCISRVW